MYVTDNTTVVEMNLASFDLVQVTLILLTKFRVHWPFGSGEQTQNRWRPFRTSNICPDACYQVSGQLAQGVGE